MSAVPDWHRDDRVESLRIPPHAIDAEQNVLGALMLANEQLAKVSDWLAPEDFYRRDHQEIYRAILAVKSADPITLGDWFEAQGKGELVQNGAYLGEIASQTASTANLIAYAEIVKQKSQLRQAIEIGHELQNAGFQPDGRDAGEIAADATRKLQDIRGSSRGGGLLLASEGLNDWYEDLIRRYEQDGSVTGLPYPWAEVNRVTHGLQPGELTIIAARPSMGKSIMGLNLALMTALRGDNTALFSLEMTTRQVNRRNIASLENVPYGWLLAPGKDQDETDWTHHVSNAIRQLKGASLLIDESAGLSIDKIVARARRAHMQKPIKLLVLDHMHEVRLPGKKDTRFEVGDIADAGKALAKEFDCPAVWLAQLNRGLESRADKRPQMNDLRESGEIEQKADVIWFLYREDYYQRTNTKWTPRHDVELILGKGRDLEVGAPIVLREDYRHMKLTDWDEERHGPVPARHEAPSGGKKGGLS